MEKIGCFHNLTTEDWQNIESGLQEDRAYVCSAIADQELTIAEIAMEIKANQNTLKNPLLDVLESCIKKQFLRRSWVNGVAYFESTQSLPKTYHYV